MTLYLLVISLLGMVGIFIGGMNYKSGAEGKLCNLITTLMCSASAVYQLIQYYILTNP